MPDPRVVNIAMSVTSHWRVPTRSMITPVLAIIVGIVAVENVLAQTGGGNNGVRAKAADAQMGTLAVRSPEDATLTIDGKKLAATLVAGKIQILTLSPGQHILEASSTDGKSRYEKIVTIQAGMQTVELLQFNPTATTAKQSSVSVQIPADWPKSTVRDKKGYPIVHPVQARQFAHLGWMGRCTELKDFIKTHHIDVTAAVNSNLLPACVPDSVGQVDDSSETREIGRLIDEGRHNDALTAANTFVVNAAERYRRSPVENSQERLTSLSNERSRAAQTYFFALLARSRTFAVRGDWSKAFSDLATAEPIMEVGRREMLLPRKLDSALNAHRGMYHALQGNDGEALTYLAMGRFSRICEKCNDSSQVVQFLEFYAKESDSNKEAITSHSHSQGSSIDSEIDSAIARGHSELPKPVTAQRSSGGRPVLAVQNLTSMTLSVLLSGPSSQRMTLAPSERKSIELNNGSYRVLGSVSGANVLPAYGTYSFDTGSEYSISYSIK